MKLLSPGEKLRSIRKELKINQSDITGGEITRELISIIENDKCRITYQVANIIANNINKIFKERNIDFTIEPSYLLEDIKVQALKIADGYIEELLNCHKITDEFEEKLSEIEGFLIKYDTDNKALAIYERIADIYKDTYEYNKSYKYYIKALENHRGFFDEIDLFRLFKKLGVICILLTRYKEALEFNKSALVYKENVPDNLICKVYCNKALCYFHMEEYKTALEEIDFIEVNCKGLSDDEKFKINSLKASCLSYLKFYSEALEIDKKLVDSLADDDIKNKLLALVNMLDIYVTINDIDNMKLYIPKIVNESKKLIEGEVAYFLPKLYKELGHASVVVKEFGAAKEYFNTSIKLYKNIKSMYDIEVCLKEYLALLVEEGNEEEINILKNQILEFISLELLPKNNEINLHLISYYNSKKDLESIQALLDFLI